MARRDLPDPAPKLELERLLGAWYVLFSDRADWRSRTHPRLELDELERSGASTRMRMTLRFRSPDLLGRARPRVTSAEAVVERGAPVGLFRVRGQGLIRASSSRFSVAIVGPEHRWVIVWHGRSSLGHAAGLDVCTRDPSLPQAEVDVIVAAIAEHPFASAQKPKLFAVTQDWFPATPYRLG